MNQKRVRLLKGNRLKSGPIVYWMSRDQRANDNWALIFSQEIALKHGKPLVVVFCLLPKFLDATLRQYCFMLKGLLEVENRLRQKNIAFYLLTGDPEKEIPRFTKKYRTAAMITDFDPLRIKKRWKESIAKNISLPFYEVDAHNIVPCWIASKKQEYGAYTFRPKIKKALPEFLERFPRLKKHPFSWEEKTGKADWDRVMNTLKVDISVPEVSWIQPGEKAALKMLHPFLKDKLAKYNERRNDPNLDAPSNLSPYLHFGHISAQRVALEVQKTDVMNSSKEAFLEELIVRRELSDNFCFYNTHYDSFLGFPDWAKKTLNEHKKNKREYQYSLSQFEGAQTHDELWNAAQMQMVKTGKMHGYMRMYWCKKILEWTKTPEEAFNFAIYLNDKYELDGRDPNGYVGIAWSIGGVHDRAWKERDVFGKIRYMSYSGCKSKFKIEEYISSHK
ncbi:MAG TPA: deoxyribodipyrimidine photo-lyase [Nitrospinota bacterium]|nr:deoxyribodipyrimidine photo-lyase [Nitrospinota bacterium]